LKYFNGKKTTLDEKKIETPSGPARVTETEDYTETTTNDSVIRRYK
jgi:hypothetical protein